MQQKRAQKKKGDQGTRNKVSQNTTQNTYYSHKTHLNLLLLPKVIFKLIRPRIMSEIASRRRR
jgi:hypothetical protein